MDVRQLPLAILWALAVYLGALGIDASGLLPFAAGPARALLILVSAAIHGAWLTYILQRRAPVVVAIAWLVGLWSCTHGFPRSGTSASFGPAVLLETLVLLLALAATPAPQTSLAEWLAQWRHGCRRVIAELRRSARFDAGTQTGVERHALDEIAACREAVAKVGHVSPGQRERLADECEALMLELAGSVSAARMIGGSAGPVAGRAS